MSEFIEKRRELSIKEYEFMKLLKLFTEDEIREIKSKRFTHENKVERRAKELADFIGYIAYECNLLQLLGERRKKLRVHDGRHSLESSIHHRIKMLYKRGMDRFPSEYRLWVHYLGHCERYSMLPEGSRTLDKMLNYHGDKPKAWIRAAEWEYGRVKNMERARHFMFRGLQRHPECMELYLSFLGLLVKEAVKIVKESEEGVEELLEREDSAFRQTLESLNLIYEHYKKREPSLEFYVKLLDALKHKPEVKSFGVVVLNDLKEQFATKEAMWSALAQLALDGSYLLDDSKDVSFPERLKNCVGIYDEAVETLPTKQMWTLYVDAVLKLNEDMTSHQKLRRKTLGNVFKKAFESGSLEEDKYVQYLKLMINVDQPQESLVTAVLTKAIESYPKSTKLWVLHLTFLAKQEAPASEIEDIFKKALVNCTEDLLSLWTVRFQYYHTRTDLPKALEQTFKDAIVQPPTIASHFQPLYLEFLVVTRNIDAARKKYLEIQKNCAPCLELHRKMSQLESIQAQPNVDHWRKCHENASHFFGTDNIDVWIDFLAFERDHGSPRNMQPVFERAKARLDADLVAGFVTEYELLKNPLI
uniref:U3 small nucleolar RNA-associated protein 6 homolog n=1 Tax=Culex pipiens TaxID=7175 RepID=A0A8D8B5S7_CULPI